MFYTVFVLLMIQNAVSGMKRNLLQQNIEEICGVEQQANYKGDLLLVGNSNLKDSLEDCCRSCQEDAKCNVFVYCGVPSGCNNIDQVLPYKRCDLKYQQIVEEGGEPEFWYKGNQTDFTSGAFMKSSMVPLPPPGSSPDASTFLPAEIVPSPPPSNISPAQPPSQMVDPIFMNVPSPEPTPSPQPSPSSPPPSNISPAQPPSQMVDPISMNVPSPEPSPSPQPSPSPLLDDPIVVNPGTSAVPSPEQKQPLGDDPIALNQSPSNGVPIVGTTPFDPELLQFRNTDGQVPAAEPPAVEDVVKQDPIAVNNK